MAQEASLALVQVLEKFMSEMITWRDEMVNRMRHVISLAVVFALASLGLTVQAQRPYRLNDQQVQQIIRRIENRTDVFRSSLDAALDRSRMDGTNREENINRFVREYEHATNRLRDRFNERRSVAADVEEVLDRAMNIDNFMRSRRLGVRAERDWANLRMDLNELAQAYNVSRRLGGGGGGGGGGRTYYPPANQGQGSYGANRLTGTYRLDASRSDDPRDAADRATRNLPFRDRQRALDALTARLESPDQIAIDRRGRTVTIASTRAPQITFEADGRESVERTGSGRMIRARATLSGDMLTVSSTGDRGNDYNVTFTPIEGGRRLSVTRRVITEDLPRPVVVQSIYDRVSDVAQFNIYNGPDYSRTGQSYPDTGRASGSFVIPNGTTIVAVLNDNLTTGQTRDRDRFTMTVREPSQYDGATIEGYVSNLSRGGRVSGRSEMTLNFESIRLRDGSSYRFAGVVENVRTASGETVRVDNEGSVQESDSRGTTTAQRAAIGTAVGAVIGAIAGGGKGAAIGAILGAGGGAGSVYVQGRDDLELMSGTEVTIRASAPR